DIAPTLLLTWNEPEQNLRIISQAVNRAEQAAQIINKTEQQIAAARETFASLIEAHPKLLLLLLPEFPTIYLGSGDQFGLCSSLIKELGFELVSFPEASSDAANSPQTPISLEALPQLNEADSIIVLGTNASQIQQFDTMDEFEEHQLSNLQPAWETNAIAQSLDASQAGRVYFIPYYLCAGLPGSIGTELYLEKLQEQLLGPN
ncbi:MAG: ABC transporter substrate-binding protein, partial [Cyanobacteria bacterium P01_H01_bin.119]